MLCSATIATPPIAFTAIGSAHQRRHQDHAPPDHPDHTGQQIVRKVEIECPGDAKYRQLKQDEKGAPRQEKSDNA